MIDSDKIINEFKRIQALGFIKSNRSHNTGIGKTFEDYLGKKEDNKKDPDFEGFEVKSQRELAKSYITLFTKKATYPENANLFLKDNFGKPHRNHPNLFVLHTSIYGNRFNKSYKKFGYKMTVDEDLKRLGLEVKSLSTDEILSDEVYWDFKDIQGDKLKNTFFVSAEHRFVDGHEYFHYTKAIVYYEFSFQKLIEGVKNGAIRFDIRMGSYPSGSVHDHGSGFRVKREHLKDLFEHFIEI